MKIFSALILGLFLNLPGLVGGARPMIWVTPEDRLPILAKIESQEWARADFATMEARVAADLQRHGEDPEAFLKTFPLVWNTEDPTRNPTLARVEGNMASLPVPERTNALPRYLQVAVDCGVLYFLTEDPAYAQCAADILHLTVEGLVQMEADPTPFNGGLLYPGDHLFEARLVAAQVPLIYDFVAEYLKAGATVYNVSLGGYRSFDFENAQEVFRHYARLAVERGIIDCNWPVLEMASLTHNTLALEDPVERAEMLRYVTHENTPHQDSLRKVVGLFDHPGAVWPEPFGYSGAVAELTNYIVALLLRQETPVALPEHFLRVPMSLSRLQDFEFPNGEDIRFGDGPRRSREKFEAYEISYAIGIQENNQELTATFGPMIARGLHSGAYKRAMESDYHLRPHPYLEPIQLLWFAPEIKEAPSEKILPTTDTLRFAGAVLQRNLAPDKDPDHGLMAAVLGAHYVHAHASGMSLELYGAGEVLGTPSGKGVYRSDEHENYRRLFASYNCVIVNGASSTEGGWVNLGMNTVQTVTLEPAVGAAPVSPHHSFTLTSFRDDKGNRAEAYQERLVGIVRTSAKTGYYVDVFRSRSALPNQFHDYVYHNIGDGLTLTAPSGPLELSPSPNRFVPAPGTEWISNQSYLFPGWHFFTEAHTSAPAATDVQVHFAASELKPAPAHMRLFIPGSEGREYSSAFSPETKNAPQPYANQPAPVFVMRQTGEAWDRPFAVILEPFKGETDAGSVQAVEALRDGDGTFSGFKVTSTVDGETLVQWVLTLESPTSRFRDEARGIDFEGSYAVITMDAAGRCQSLYLGEGTRLKVGAVEVSSATGDPSAIFVEYQDGAPQLVSATTPVLLSSNESRESAPSR